MGKFHEDYCEVMPVETVWCARCGLFPAVRGELRCKDCKYGTFALRPTVIDELGACVSPPDTPEDEVQEMLDIFFPGVGRTDLARQAKKICASCPVQAECLEWALGIPEQAGIVGGTTERERRTIRNQRKEAKRGAAA